MIRPRSHAFRFGLHGRMIHDAPWMIPFCCHAIGGNAMRNGHVIAVAGWYFVDELNQLHGPYNHKKVAARSIRQHRIDKRGRKAVP